MTFEQYEERILDLSRQSMQAHDTAMTLITAGWVILAVAFIVALVWILRPETIPALQNTEREKRNPHVIR